MVQHSGRSIALLMTLTFLLVLVTACTTKDRDLTLAVSTEEPAPSIAESIQSHFQKSGVSIVLEVETDSTQIIEAVRSRNIDLGVIEEPDFPIPGIVTLAPLYPSVLHVLHNKPEIPSDFVTLVRKSRIYAGPKGGTAYRLFMQLATDFNITAADYELLENPWTLTPDVYFIFGGLLPDDSIRQLNGYRLFSFANKNDIPGGSAADGIVLKHHHLKPFLLPRSVYYTLNDAPVVTLSIRTVLIAHEDFGPDLAFDITSHLFNNAQKFALSYPLVTRELNVDLNAAEHMLPLHSGTRRFLDHDKPGLIERNTHIIALIITISITLGSGLIALYRHGRQVKKDRVDNYYLRLLDIRKNAEKTNDNKTLKQQRELALSVQQEVLDLLIAERVAADTSLMAFLSLSNQIINELNHRIGHKL